jgi:anti-sigma regulatory factor (Ser/Thr protein kinase)
VVAGSPTCLAGLRPVRSSLQELPGATIPGDVVDDLVLAVSEAATNAILYGSCYAQPVKVTIGVQGGGIEATIRDQGRPPSRTAPLMSLRGRGLWLIGQLVDECTLPRPAQGHLVTFAGASATPPSASCRDGPVAVNERRPPPPWLTTRRRG